MAEYIEPTQQEILETTIETLTNEGIFNTPWNFKIRLAEITGLAAIDPSDVFNDSYKLEVYDYSGVTGKVFIGEEAKTFKLFLSSLDKAWQELKVFVVSDDVELAQTKYEALKVLCGE